METINQTVFMQHNKGEGKIQISENKLKIKLGIPFKFE